MRELVFAFFESALAFEMDALEIEAGRELKELSDRELVDMVQKLEYRNNDCRRMIQTAHQYYGISLQGFFFI